MPPPVVSSSSTRKNAVAQRNQLHCHLRHLRRMKVASWRAGAITFHHHPPGRLIFFRCVNAIAFVAPGLKACCVASGGNSASGETNSRFNILAF
jgi:hypothetical protein